VYPFVQSTPFGKVKIYRNEEANRTRYIVAWLDPDNGRQRKAYDDEVQAHQRAEELVDDLQKGVSFRNNITATKAVRIAELESALAEHGATLSDAVKHYLLHLDSKKAKQVDVLEVVNQYLDRMEDKTGRHYETACCVLKKFGRSFNKSLSDVSVTEIDNYIKGISSKGRTRNNHLRYIKILFKHAQEWGGFLPEGQTAASKINKYNEDAVAVEVFSPAEIRKLLEAGGNLMPYLAVGAFAGVRCSEIQRLKWEDFDFESNTIRMDAGVTKTKRRRLAVMPDNLVAWLNSYTGTKKGPIVLQPNRLAAHIQQLCKKTKVAWKPNALRKSFISYRMAQPDAEAALVAKQCGNSPAMVEEHYKGLVSPKVAEEWFSLNPTTNT